MEFKVKENSQNPAALQLRHALHAYAQGARGVKQRPCFKALQEILQGGSLVVILILW